MSEIVFAQTFEQRQDVPHMTYGRQPTDKKVTIFQSPGKVAVVQSTLVCGVPRGHSDKRYYYWRTVASAGFRRNKAGTVVPFSCTRPWDAKVGVAWRHKWPNEPFNWLNGTVTQPDDAGQAFQRAVWDEFGVRSVQELYPMLDRYGLPSYATIPSSLKVPFRSDDWEVFAQKVFGKTRTNKRLVEALQKTEPYFVAYAQQFRGLVADSAIQDFFDRNEFDEDMEVSFRPHSPNIRKFLLNTNQQTRDNLINITFDLSDLNRVANFVLFGERTMLRYANGGVYKNWSELARW